MSNPEQPANGRLRSPLFIAAIALALLCLVLALGLWTGHQLGAWGDSDTWLVRLGIYGALITGGASLFAARFFARNKRGRPWEIM